MCSIFFCLVMAHVGPSPLLCTWLHFSMHIVQSSVSVGGAEAGVGGGGGGGGGLRSLQGGIVISSRE